MAMQMIRILTMILASALLTCESVPQEDETPDSPLSINQELERIRSNYTPPACLYATFRIQARVAGQAPQDARGVLRADNQNDRMLLILRDPYIGLTLSRIMARENTVYLSNPRTDLQTIPVDQFQVSGMGHNRVALPFEVFRDLLFARLPVEEFTRNARVRRDQNGLNIELNRNGDAYRYNFVDQKLRRIEYAPRGGNTAATASLTGNYRDSSFPASIRLESGRPGAAAESLEVRFDSINANAECRDTQFPPR